MKSALETMTYIDSIDRVPSRIFESIYKLFVYGVFFFDVTCFDRQSTIVSFDDYSTRSICLPFLGATQVVV